MPTYDILGFTREQHIAYDAAARQRASDDARYADARRAVFATINASPDAAAQRAALTDDRLAALIAQRLG